MDDDTGDYRRLWSQKYDLEREVKQDWFQKLKRDGEEVPQVMGRSVNQTTEDFVDDYNRRYQEEMKSRAEIRARFEKNNNNFNIAEIQAEEEKKEKIYEI